jgi:hypothetical protein
MLAAEEKAEVGSDVVFFFFSSTNASSRTHWPTLFRGH